MRRVLENENYQLVYGKDFLLGYFVEVYDKDGQEIINWKGITLEKIVKYAEEYGFDISDELSEGEVVI